MISQMVGGTLGWVIAILYLQIKRTIIERFVLFGLTQKIIVTGAWTGDIEPVILHCPSI